MVVTFEKTVAQELSRLSNERRELEERIATIDEQMKAIRAYQSTLGLSEGQSETNERPIHNKGKANKEAIIKALRGSKKGRSKKEVARSIGLPATPTDRSLSNALQYLKRTGQIDHRDGRYYLPASEIKK